VGEKQDIEWATLGMNMLLKCALPMLLCHSIPKDDTFCVFLIGFSYLLSNEEKKM
jgi:hypothetical protein